MNQNEIINFFNQKARTWDRTTIRRETAISDILDFAEITNGKNILDVACGTGVLFPDYLNRGVKSVLGVDISPKMVEIAKEKYKSESRIRVICADAQKYKFPKEFHSIMIHNAFPHFERPRDLIENLSESLLKGGRLTVAHSMSKKEIDECHRGSAGKISVKLMDENELAELMSEFLEVDTVISDDEKYIVSAIKR